MNKRILEVVDYQAQWQTLYEQEKQLLLSTLALSNIVNIYHIGSTSVPDLAAKPIIDILLEVNSLSVLDETNKLFKQINYIAKGENGIANRRYFQKGGNQRTHHLHAFNVNDPHIIQHLAFRDYLREFAQVKNAYGKLKKQAVLDCNGNMEKYMACKNDFIQYQIEQALIWRQDKKGYQYNPQ